MPAGLGWELQVVLFCRRKWRSRQTQLAVCVSGRGSLRSPEVAEMSGRPDLGKRQGWLQSWESPSPGFHSSPRWVWGMGEELHSFPPPQRAAWVCHDRA